MRFAIDLRTIIWLIVAAAVVVFRGPIFISLLPFLLGFVLANFIEPLVALFERRTRLPRAMAAAVGLGVLVLVLGYLGSWATSQIAHELIELSQLLPVHQRTAMEMFNSFLAWSQGIFQDLPEEMQTYVQDSVQDLARGATELAGAVINRVLTAMAAVPTITLVLVIGIVATYFFSKDRDVIQPALVNALPARMRETVATARDKILVDLGRFFKAYIILFFISATLGAVGLSFVDTKYWLVLSLTMAVLDSIPIVGPAFVLLPWAAVSLYMGAVRQAVILAVLCAVMFVVRQVLQPKLLGDSVGVHPLMMLLAIWGGLVTVGALGIIVGPVVVIIAKAIRNAGLFGKAMADDEEGAAVKDSSEIDVAAAVAAESAGTTAADKDVVSAAPMPPPGSSTGAGRAGTEI